MSERSVCWRNGIEAGHRRVRSFWFYVIGPGALSWAALHYGGFHPALALVPIVPFMPRSARDLGLFDPREGSQIDTLNQFEDWWAVPVQFVLLLFGLATAGVPFEQIGPGDQGGSIWAGPVTGPLTHRSPGKCFGRPWSGSV